MTIEKRLDQVFDAFTTDLQQLVRIPSVLNDELDGAPFGRSIDDALEATVEIAKKLGFTTFKDPAGYYAYADIGSGDEMIGILGHLDVVPAGDLDAWNKDPFDPVIEDGKMFGRGTQDDKGPLLASMYAVKALIDDGVQLNKTIRFIFGTDEETLWRGIQQYEKKERMPDYGFSPDSKFPLIFAEKGLLQCKLTGPGSGVKLVGGDAFNSVPSKIRYEGDRQEDLGKALDQLGFDYEADAAGLTIMGKSVHAQAAETGINAIARTALALEKIGLTSPSIALIAKEIGEDAFGQKIFGPLEDEASGKLKCNVGKVDLTDKGEVISLDLRIPVTVDKNEVVEKLEKVANKYGLKYEEHDYLRSIYVPLESMLVKKLMKAYVEVTGDKVSQPVTSGGATYARAMDNCVAFGAVLPGSPKTEHQPNEYIILDDMRVAMKVYAAAIQQLLDN